MSTVAEIQAAIERLSPAEVEGLATWLDQRRPSAGFDPAVEEAWSVEIQRRIADFDSGRVTGVPAAEVFAELDKKLRRLDPPDRGCCPPAIMVPADSRKYT